jgi:hypothetical protein
MSAIWMRPLRAARMLSRPAPQPRSSTV